MAYYNCTIAKRDILSVKRREAAAEHAFTTVLRDAVEAVSQSGYPFLVLGGLASALVGRPGRPPAWASWSAPVTPATFHTRSARPGSPTRDTDRVRTTRTSRTTAWQ